MTEEKFIHTNLKNELTHDFLVEILKHYHYEQKDMEMLKEVAGELRECLAGEEGFYCMTRRQCEQILNLCREENYAIGIFTLGSRVDELENRYSSTERLREAYAVETICWELLRKGYDMFQRWAEAHLKQRLESYHFFGSEEGLPFEKMAQLLAEMGQNRITCNQAYCMEPKKSVMFLAELSGGSLKVESKRNFREKSGESSGAGVKWNAAETENRGIELALNTRNIVKKDFTWSSTVTFTANKEKIKSLIEGQDMMFNAKKGDMVFKVGEGVGSFYRYKVLGIWQYSEKETAALFGCEPGDIKLDLPSVKKDGNGYYYMNPEGERVDITAENPYGVRADYDRQVIGRNTPDWTLGFKNNFRYKDFDLSVFLYARWGQMMNYGSVIGKYSPNPDYNIPTYFTYYDKTIEADQDVLFYAIDKSKDRSAYEGYDSMYYVDGSFFKLKNVTLGYTLPGKLTKRFGISNLRVYATMTNLFTYSPNKYVKNYDPEMNGSINFPLSRDCIFGLNLTF